MTTGSPALGYLRHSLSRRNVQGRDLVLVLASPLDIHHFSGILRFQAQYIPGRYGLIP